MVYAVYDGNEGLLAAFIYLEDAEEYLSRTPDAQELVYYEGEMVFHKDYGRVDG